VSRRSWLIFGALALIWGIPYLFIKLAVDGGLPPATLACARIAIGAVILLALATQARVLGSLRGHWPWIVVFAVVELAVAALVLVPFALLDAPSWTPSATAWAALAVLGVLCTATMAILIVAAGPSRASLITYINPVVAVALGVVVLGEHPGVVALIGLVAILGGSWLGSGGRAAAPRPTDGSSQAGVGARLS